MKVNDFTARTIGSALATVVMLIPFWIWLGTWYLAVPEGFWQKAFLLGIGVWFLGAFQLIFLIFLVALLFVIWKD